MVDGWGAVAAALGRVNFSIMSEMKPNLRMLSGSLFGLALAGLLLGEMPALGREPDEPPTGQDRGGRGRDDAPDIKHHGTVVGRIDKSDSGKGDGGAVRPDALPADVKVMIEKFKVDREKFLKQQQELERQLKQDSQSNRDALRDQLRASLDKWKEQQKEFRDRLKERMRDLKDEVQELEPVVSSGKGRNGSGHGRDLKDQ